MSREIFHCLKRERDICIQTIIPSKNMALMLTPALIQCSLQNRRISGAVSETRYTSAEREARDEKNPRLCIRFALFPANPPVLQANPVQPNKESWQLKILAFLAVQPKWDQNPWLSLLSETTSISDLLTWEPPPPGLWLGSTGARLLLTLAKRKQGRSRRSQYEANRSTWLSHFFRFFFFFFFFEGGK